MTEEKRQKTSRGKDVPYMEPVDGGKVGAMRMAPAGERNRQAIIGVLETILPQQGRILEIASGTGQHAVAFAKHFADLEWHPSDQHPASLASIEAWQEEANLSNLAKPLDIDVTKDKYWQSFDTSFAAMIAINLVHIAPWKASLGLMAGAGALLEPGGVLYCYGCFKREGAHISASNEKFDKALKVQDSAWGVRDSDDMKIIAEQAGLELEKIIDMPAKNLSLVFRKKVS